MQYFTVEHYTGVRKVWNQWKFEFFFLFFIYRLKLKVKRLKNGINIG
jgi:hypothetical protein